MNFTQKRERSIIRKPKALEEEKLPTEKSEIKGFVEWQQILVVVRMRKTDQGGTPKDRTVEMKERRLGESVRVVKFCEIL